MQQIEENISVRDQVKNVLLSGKRVTSCGAASTFFTADLRKIISVLRGRGLKITDELIENGNKKRYKEYFIKLEDLPNGTTKC